MKARGFARRGAAVVSVAMLATAGLVFAVGASAGASSVEKSFEEDGEHEWVVPAGVCSVWVDAFGASGGDATGPPDDGDVDAAVEGQFTAAGGEGGEVEARIPVTPGETLHIFVGGEGEDAVPGVGATTLAGEGGFNGGGDGGAAGGTTGDGGAGGGGASDVRQGGDELGDRVVVAGGGGGAAVRSNDSLPTASDGGEGGGEDGEDGQPSFDGTTAQAGGGASQTDGGDGGVGDLASLNGDEGSKGEGGDGGGDATDSDTDGGGGGGGGFYGGGGGGGADDGTPVDDGAGGGGGSGYGPYGAEYHTGDHEGDGEVTISYDPVADGCAAEAIVIEPKFTG